MNSGLLLGRQSNRCEGLVLGAKVLPANDLPFPELEDAATFDVRLYAAASRSDVNVAPGEYPLAKIGELSPHFELLEELERVGDKGFEARETAIGTLRRGS